MTKNFLFTRVAVIAAIFALASAGFVFDQTALAGAPTVTYTGQGFNFDGSTYNVNDERCGTDGQGAANDGSTGQFANWNGPGQPYQPGQPYLLWVLTLNTGKNAQVVKLHLPDGEVDMIKVGGTYKYASAYYLREDIVSFPAHATFSVSSKNVQLVVSHGCAPFQDDGGAWCSPGYWRNAQDAAWTLTGYAKEDLFNDVVVPSFYDTAYASVDLPDGPTLIQVLTTPGANTFGSSSAPFGLNAFNATGAALTNALPGYSFSLAVMEADENELTCPIDNHGNWKKGTVWNP